MYILGSRFALVVISLGIVLLLVLILALRSRRTLENYTNPSGPFYEGHYAESEPQFDSDLKVVNWNISFSKRVDEAIQALKGVEELQDADILLLQEMETEGVDQIARNLGYDYVYYPASVHSRHGNDFGEAILSKWPIVQHAKVILPNTVPAINPTRIAVRAEIFVDGIQVNVYNTHLETIWMLQKKGNTQVDYLADQVEGDGDSVVLGGDFNTWNQGSIDYLEARLGQSGMKRVSARTGYTFTYHGLKLTLDHMFAQGVSNYDSGVWRETNVSDHFPLWAVLQLQDVP